MHLHRSQCFHCVKTDTVHKTRYLSEITRLTHPTSFLLKNAFKRRKTLVLALVGLVLHNSMHLHRSQCFHCVKTDTVHKTRYLREITRFSASNVVFAKNAFKRRKTLVLALVSLVMHNSMHLHRSQCFHCVKTDTVHKTRYLREITRFSASNVVFAEKRV